MLQSNPYKNRRWTVSIFFTVIALVYVGRLFFLQIVDDQWKQKALDNALKRREEVPPRGFIYDRNGEKMVDNIIRYDLMVVPRNVSTMDTAEFCLLPDLTHEEFCRRLEKAKNYSWYIPSIFMQALPEAMHAYVLERLYKFQGFYSYPRTIRHYHTAAAAHTLGYISQVSAEDLEEDAYYSTGDYIGKSGIERSYEEALRGKKGKKFVLVDNLGREQGTYKDGQMDVEALPGMNLWSSLDHRLQQYGEWLMQGKRGSIVAIEPSSGEILCLVTSPSYDPALLVGKQRGKNYTVLHNDSLNRPLINRALNAIYPPGSTFKLVNALIAQQTGAVDEHTRYGCQYGFAYGNRKLGCHGHPVPLDIAGSVQNSCNAWYCRAFKAMLENRDSSETVAQAYQRWREMVLRMGFGKKLDGDLPYQVKGFVPEAEFYDKRYGENRWQATSIISVSIGQGEICVTPVQLANLAAIIANRGYYFMPHLVRAIDRKDSLNTRFGRRILAGIERRYYKPVIDGMVAAVSAGTARRAGVSGVVVAAKTGTAENPHGADHSILVCFAPVDTPRIAISVVVENGGFGATWAAPIAGLMIEKYLHGEVGRQELASQIANGRIVYKPERKKKP